MNIYILVNNNPCDPLVTYMYICMNIYIFVYTCYVFIYIYIHKYIYATGIHSICQQIAAVGTRHSQL